MTLDDIVLEGIYSDNPARMVMRRAPLVDSSLVLARALPEDMSSLSPTLLAFVLDPRLERGAMLALYTRERYDALIAKAKEELARKTQGAPAN